VDDRDGAARAVAAVEAGATLVRTRHGYTVLATERTSAALIRIVTSDEASVAL
jgi:hypothetical protein